MTRRRIINLVLSVAAVQVTVATLMAPSVEAAQSRPSPTPVAKNLAWRAELSPTSSSSRAGSTSGVLQTWGACGAFDSNTKLIRTFTRAATTGVTPYLSSGTAALACGSSAWGYRHIVANHLSQWQARATLAGENWRDTADYGMEWALKDPDRIRYRSSNDTYCYSRLIYLVDERTGKVVGSYYPNVVVARVTKNVITAIPSSAQCT